MINLKSEREIQIIKSNGKILAGTLNLLGEHIKPGMRTVELDKLAADFIRENKAVAAFKGYRGFPAHICVSVNDEVVHGIPGERVLKEGEVVSIDVGVFKDGYYADGAFTFPVGKVSSETERLLKVAEASLLKGLEAARMGNHLLDISYEIQSFVEKNGFSVVRDLVGHGIGQKMHEEPQVPNFGKPGLGIPLEEGMILAIEPMVNMGSHEVKTLDDQWTVVTQDGSLSAHFEHTIAITRNGPEVLTQ
jgi:methionyl aminopeptidase